MQRIDAKLCLVHSVIVQLYLVGFGSVDAQPCLEQNICTAMFRTVRAELTQVMVHSVDTHLY